MGYIEKGCFKYVVRDSRGYEHIINFEFSGGFIGTVLDVIYDLPTKFSIIAISSADIYSITGDDLRTWASDDKDFRIKLAQLSDMIFMEFRNRTILSYTMTPKEQYEMLMAENPELFETLRLSDIASFLRITPEHLSRIRKSLRAE